MSFTDVIQLENMLLEIINTNTRHLHQLVEERIMESQIFSLQWLRNDALIACGANGLLRIFNFTITGGCVLHTHNAEVTLLQDTFLHFFYVFII